MFRLLAIVLFLLAWFAAAASETSIATEGPADSWRQTRQGWQRSEVFLGPPIEYRRPALHPTVVGSLEVLLTMAAMLALSGEPQGRRERRKPA